MLHRWTRYYFICIAAFIFLIFFFFFAFPNITVLTNFSYCSILGPIRIEISGRFDISVNKSPSQYAIKSEKETTILINKNQHQEQR